MVESLEALLGEVPVPTPVRADSTPPNLAAARACVDWMSGAILQLNRRIGFEPWTSVLMRDLVLSSASQAAVFWRAGWNDHARKSLLHCWIDQSQTVESPRLETDGYLYALPWAPAGSTGARLQHSDLDREFLLVFGVAVSEKLSADQTESQARQALRQLVGRLGLTNDDLAQLLGVSAEIVDQWESALEVIPADGRATLIGANKALSRLLATFRPERLPQVIRQSVELFGGQSAYDWIRQGRIEEVADLYEAAFTHQG